ncbi:MAG: carbon monoxide dehydrogenase subunit G [Acidobacteria bacterium]|nr:carbon monoxide dehydrogenase subunit G [Acidobacteriota bacterium]
MHLHLIYQLPAPRERVFAAMTDPAVLQRCIPGCEQMIKDGEDSYEAHLQVGFAGLKGKYRGRARVEDRRPPESYTLTVDGKGAPGFVRATSRMCLGEKGEGTEVICDADVQIGGVIAAVGSRLLDAAARKMADDFFRALSRELTPMSAAQ